VLFVALDLGGSGTRAILADGAGNLLASGLGPAAGHRSGAAGRRGVVRALSPALAGIVPLTRNQQCVVWAGSAGLSIPGRREWLQVELSAAFPAARIEVSDDAETAVAGGLGEAPGVAVLAGTGSIAIARDQHGHMARAGGWGYLLGDEGSAYSLGRDALRALLTVLEGRTAAGELTRLVRQTLSVTTPTEAIGWATAGDDRVTRVASLAPLVARAADAGDIRAVAILRGAAIALAEIGRAAAHQLALVEPVRVVCIGSVWRAGTGLRDAFVAAWPSAIIDEPMLAPVFGAVLLAMGDPEPGVVERLRDANRTAWRES
jgi:N-acetylglucosamine kinase-like BadF-type ATPase